MHIYNHKSVTTIRRAIGTIGRTCPAPWPSVDPVRWTAAPDCLNKLFYPYILKSERNCPLMGHRQARAVTRQADSR